MPWFQGVLASFGFFLLSIFGGSHQVVVQTPPPPVSQTQATSTSQFTPNTPPATGGSNEIASTSSTTTPYDPPIKPCTQPSNTAIQQVDIRNNNLYINCKLTVQDIPATLGLGPSTGGQIIDPTVPDEGFISGLASINISGDSYVDGQNNDLPGTADLYTSATTSPTDDVVAILYNRVDHSLSGDRSFSSILVYSPEGNLVSRFDLTPTNPVIAALPESYGPNNKTGGAAQVSVLGINNILYVDKDRLYAANDAGIDSPVDYYFEIASKKLTYIGFTTGTEVFSPDGKKMAYVPEDITPYIADNCDGGLGTSNTSEVDIADFSAGTNYSITHDRTKPYNIVGWSADSSTLAVEVGVADSTDSCVDHYDNFFTYDLNSNTTTNNTNPDWSTALNQLCKNGQYSACDNYTGQ